MKNAGDRADDAATVRPEVVSRQTARTAAELTAAELTSTELMTAETGSIIEAGEIAAVASMSDELAAQAGVKDKSGKPTGWRKAWKSSAWASVGRSAGAKILVLPVSALLGIVNVRLIIEHLGRDAFAQYGLLVAIGNLLPFADLGISAAVMNVVGQSDNPRIDPKVHRMLVSTIRILIGSFSVLLSLSVLITSMGWWPDILGDGLEPTTGPVVAALCLAMIAVSLLFGFSQRILAGGGRNHVSVALLGLQTPIVLVVLLIVIHTHSRIGPYIAVVPYVATLLIQVVTTFFAARQIHPMLGRAVRDVPRLRTVKGGRVFDVAWPMMIQMVALPIATQTDRIMLSHFSTRAALAQYNLASQMFTPIWQVVSAAGFALWPIFAKQRAGNKASSPIPISFAFGGAAALITLIIASCSGLLARVASGGQIRLGLLVVIVFSVYMVFQALKYPLGMYMTDAAGLRYQAYMILLMVPINVGISYWLAGSIGAAGPIIGSLVGVVFFQYLANLVYVRRQQRIPTALVSV